MNNVNAFECNGPILTSNENDITKSWNNRDIKNGYLKTENNEVIDSLLSSTTVATVVQVTGNGSKTTIIPAQKKSLKAKYLLVAFLVLIILSLICLFLFINIGGQECQNTNGKFV